ncbi:flagellar FlbD family protein [Silvibacterium dinghuense]|uniref:flagellar FlbD family protein n=1 Tax=Silvibacterium dinghuense TaxID=1560006 RepID=UPI001E398241|nr:flagellar FlbD family protein [Silvibacterium dinghuense]
MFRHSFLLTADNQHGRHTVIALTRLNGSRFILNSDLIQTIESSPDTTVTLMHGEKLLVRESAEEVRELAMTSRAHLIVEAARQCPNGLVMISGAAWRSAIESHLNAGLHTGLDPEHRS